MTKGKRVSKAPVRTEPGQGLIALTLPVAALLERSAIGVEGYLRLVRAGMLDRAGRKIKFSSAPDQIERLRRESGLDLPDGIPQLMGDVTWRRVERTWSLDVNHGLLGDDVHWWEQIARGTGDAQLRIDGVVLPESVTMRMPGAPLRDFVEHPALGDGSIVVRTVVSHPPMRFNGQDRPGRLEIKLDVPRITFPD
jgi:hypothetical protein